MEEWLEVWVFIFVRVEWVLGCVCVVIEMWVCLVFVEGKLVCGVERRLCFRDYVVGRGILESDLWKILFLGEKRESFYCVFIFVYAFMGTREVFFIS